MRLERTPFFAWSSLVQATMIIVTVPVVIGNLIFLYVDHRYGRIAFGGNKAIAPYLHWVVRQPTTALMVIPALGIIADIVPVFARVRQPMRGGMQAAIGVAGLLSFGGFAQDRLWDKVTTQPTFILVSFLAVVPPVVVLGLSGVALLTGKTKLKAPLIWALATGLMAVVTAGVGALLPIKGLSLLGTAYEQSQFDYAVGVALLAGLGGLVYWGPKLWGRLLPEGAARGLAVLGLLGVVLSSFPNVIAGFIDQPRDAVVFEKADGTAILNSLTTAGYALLALVVLATLALLARTMLGPDGDAAGDDPWEGQTLEWATSSPPPHGNFAGPLPLISSAAPLLDAREAS
jgi:heme/copper-type cytochrome/quinol oxidase subunit 1